MGIGVSIFLIAAGAVLTWAVEIAPAGLDLGAVGVILMVAGLVGVMLSFLYREDAWPFGSRDEVVERTYVEDGSVGAPGTGVVRERRTVRRHDHPA